MPNVMLVVKVEEKTFFVARPRLSWTDFPVSQPAKRTTLFYRETKPERIYFTYFAVKKYIPATQAGSAKTK